MGRHGGERKRRRTYEDHLGGYNDEGSVEGHRMKRRRSEDEEYEKITQEQVDCADVEDMDEVEECGNEEEDDTLYPHLSAFPLYPFGNTYLTDWGFPLAGSLSTHAREAQVVGGYLTEVDDNSLYRPEPHFPQTPTQYTTNPLDSDTPVTQPEAGLSSPGAAVVRILDSSSTPPRGTGFNGRQSHTALPPDPFRIQFQRESKRLPPRVKDLRKSIVGVRKSYAKWLSSQKLP